MHGDTTPRRLMAEPLLILGVHLCKVIHVDQEHIHLHHLRDGRPARLEDRLEVRDAGVCLFGYAAAYQVPGTVGGDLPAAVELGGRADGLGLWGLGESVIEGWGFGHAAYIGTGGWSWSEESALRSDIPVGIWDWGGSYAGRRPW